MASDAEVLIVGAGIAGLSAARGRSLVGRSVQVIERTSEWSIEGRGLGLLPNAMRALHTLGLADEVRASGHEVRTMRYFDRRGHLVAESVPPWPGLDQPQIELRRRALHDVLIKGVEAPIRMGTTVTQLERLAGEVAVTFSDQTTATYRLVIGAEGIHSTVRAFVATVEPRYLGQMFWRGLLEQPCGVEGLTVWIARSKYFGVTPVGHGRTRWLAQLGAEKPVTSEERSYRRLKERLREAATPSDLGAQTTNGEQAGEGNRTHRNADLRALLARSVERSGFAAEHAALSPVLLWWERNTLRESAALSRRHDFVTARSRCLDWTSTGTDVQRRRDARA
jgi:2-polyprenyl-6-methoxyphenol hydroxylase-like FAD-dependent oxidoreductase